MSRRSNKGILNDVPASEEPVEVQAEEVEKGETVEEQVDESVQAEEAPKKEAKKAEEAVEATSNEIPAKVREILRIFNAYDSLYITPWGGVFPEDHLPSHVKDAVLYKNPFFKK